MTYLFEVNLLWPLVAAKECIYGHNRRLSL